MVNKRLKELRNKLNLTQTEFGLKLGVSRSVILNIELDKVEPKEIFIDHVCSVFSVNKPWLVDGAGDCFSSADPIAEQQMDELWTMYRELNPKFQEYIRQQMDRLLQVQNSQLG